MTDPADETQASDRRHVATTISRHRQTSTWGSETIMHLARPVGLTVLSLLIALCGVAISQDAAPYAFGGIALDSSEAELPDKYKALFDSSDCRLTQQGQRLVKLCGKDFQPKTLPGLPPELKNFVHFHLNYVSGRLQQIGFRLHRDDYEAFVSFLISEYGKPLFAKSVIFTTPNTDSTKGIEYTKAIEYTWRRGRFSIATYPVLWDINTSSYNSSGVFYGVIRDAR